MLMDTPIAKRDEPPIVNERRRTWIVEARKKRGWSQTTLSRMVGCSQNELSKIETGERLRLDRQIAEAIGQHLQMTREQVMFGSIQANLVRVLGDVLDDEVVSMYSREERLEIDWLPAEEMEGYRIAVDTLEPRFNKGEILLCRPRNTTLEECYGRECVVEFEGQRYIKYVEKGAQGTSLRVVTLRSYRPSNPTLVDITPKWIAPIIAIILTRTEALRPVGTM